MYVILAKQRNLLRTLLTGILLGFLLTGSTWSPAQEAESIDWHSETCMDCHDDIPEYSHKTVHNPKFKVRCEDCHTGNMEHVDDPEPFNIVARGKESQKLCLNCHQGENHGPSFFNGAHGGAEVYCSDCHAAHRDEKPMENLLAHTTTDLCVSCHAEVKTAFNKPFSHRLNHNGVDCISCHNIHPGKNPIHALTADETCLSCHEEKRGPFVFEHVTGSAGSCLSCHEVHGSSNPMQLTRARVDQLCLECHSSQATPTFGSQPPAIHDMRSPRYRNCTTCHEAVHGSHTSPLLLK